MFEKKFIYLSFPNQFPTQVTTPGHPVVWTRPFKTCVHILVLCTKFNLLPGEQTNEIKHTFTLLGIIIFQCLSNAITKISF